jgi:hypothetical protein
MGKSGVMIPDQHVGQQYTFGVTTRKTANQ